MEGEEERDGGGEGLSRMSNLLGKEEPNLPSSSNVLIFLVAPAVTFHLSYVEEQTEVLEAGGWGSGGGGGGRGGETCGKEEEEEDEVEDKSGLVLTRNWVCGSVGRASGF